MASAKFGTISISNPAKVGEMFTELGPTFAQFGDRRVWGECNEGVSIKVDPESCDTNLRATISHRCIDSEPKPEDVGRGRGALTT